MTATQRALDMVVTHRQIPDPATIVEVIDEIHDRTATEAQLAGLIAGLVMLAKELDKR